MLSVQLCDIWFITNGIVQIIVETRVYGIVFVQPGVKVNGDYYHEVLLKEKLLPCIKEISGDNFIFQQDSAPAHRAHDTIAPLRRDVRAGLRETRKWRRRAMSAPVECVAQHWTKRHRQSDRSVAYATHRLCTTKYEQKGVILSNWCKIDLNWMSVLWLDILSQFWIEYDLVVYYLPT